MRHSGPLTYGPPGTQGRTRRGDQKKQPAAKTATPPSRAKGPRGAKSPRERRIPSAEARGAQVAQLSSPTPPAMHRRWARSGCLTPECMPRPPERAKHEGATPRTRTMRTTDAKVRVAQFADKVQRDIMCCGTLAASSTPRDCTCCNAQVADLTRKSCISCGALSSVLQWRDRTCCDAQAADASRGGCTCCDTLAAVFQWKDCPCCDALVADRPQRTLRATGGPPASRPTANAVVNSASGA